MVWLWAGGKGEDSQPPPGLSQQDPSSSRWPSPEKPKVLDGEGSESELVPWPVPGPLLWTPGMAPPGCSRRESGVV